MSAIELTMADVATDAEAVHAWLRAHDLEPNDTAPGVRVEDGQVTALVYERNPDGSRAVVRNEDTGQVIGAKTTLVACRLRQPVPAGLGSPA